MSLSRLNILNCRFFKNTFLGTGHNKIWCSVSCMNTRFQLNVNTRSIWNHNLKWLLKGYNVEHLFGCVWSISLWKIESFSHLSSCFEQDESIEKALKQKEVVAEQSPRKCSPVGCALLVACLQHRWMDADKQWKALFRQNNLKDIMTLRKFFTVIMLPVLIGYSALPCRLLGLRSSNLSPNYRKKSLFLILLLY